MRSPDGDGLGALTFAEATKEFLRVSSELDPGEALSTELIGHYGRIVANHFGVENLHDLERTSVILGSSGIAEDLTPTQLVVCGLLIGYIAGSTA